MFMFESPNLQKSSFGEVLEAFLGSPEVSWAVLARLGRIWRVPWGRPGVPEGVLEPFWGALEPFDNVLGGFWKGLGESWRLSGSILGAFLTDFLSS